MQCDEPTPYVPRPICTDNVQITGELVHLLEALARNAHDSWALQRLADGWSYGETRCDQKRTHPCLVDYSELPESEKEYDRVLVTSTLRAILALGYRVIKE
ncbi:MAG TPA: RyR domain-containing protein [Thermoanaerobaculia bacterium]|nr:RyR domain-containing protein [Thermoanaerobaculia bacterium]